jgi:hypothetical protein
MQSARGIGVRDGAASRPERSGGDEPPPNAVCATHPSRRASIACPCCGDFACASCTADTDWGDSMCELCLSQGRAQYPLPFEHGATPAAFVHTAYLVLTDTRAVFAALPHGRIWRAAVFALVSAWSWGGSAALIGVLFMPDHWAATEPDTDVLLLRALVAEPLLLLGLSCAIAACLHACATLLGGHAAFACAARAACYLCVIAVVDAVTELIDALSTGGAFIVIRMLFVMVIAAACGVRALATVAERRYGLSRNRALFSAGVALLVPTLAIRVALELAAQLASSVAYTTN